MAIGLLGGVTTYVLTNLLTFDNAATMAHFWLLLGMMAGLTARDTPLPERFGDLGKPLTYSLAKMISVASLVVGLGAVLAFGVQTTYALQTQYAIGQTVAGEKLFNAVAGASDTTTITAAFATLDNAIRILGNLAGYTVNIPENTITEGMPPLFPDPALYDNVYLALRMRRDKTAEPRYRALIYRAMRGAADRSLALYDRGPVVGRYDVLDSLGEGDLDRAERRARALVAHEPRSAESFLLLAQVHLARAVRCLSQRQMAQVEAALKPALRAVQTAVALDVTMPDARAVSGKIHYIYSQTVPGAREQYLQLALEQYQRVLELGADFTAADRLAYAATLLALGREEQAVDEALQLIRFTSPNGQLPDELGEFAAEVKRHYASRGQAATGEEILRQMDAALRRQLQPAPSPAPAPPPVAPVPWAPGLP